MTEKVSLAASLGPHYFVPVRRQQLAAVRQQVFDDCIECRLCVRECGFLQEYGTPKQLAASYDPDAEQFQRLPFECSLCRLCTAVCPVKVDPGALFLEMRREAVDRRAWDFSKHKTIINYEKRGRSPFFSLYALPKGCDTIFFPGCGLAGTRAATLLKAFTWLEQTIPVLGIVLDCCTKPSHDLGREQFFNQAFGRLLRLLLDRGITRVITACPSCQVIFSRYGDGIEAVDIYQLLAAQLPNTAGLTAETVLVQDSCVARFDVDSQAAVRKLISSSGLVAGKMKHQGKKTYCCGEGGAVGFVRPDLSRRWGDCRVVECAGQRLFAYCAGCTGFLGRIARVDHVLDLVFSPAKTMQGRMRPAKAPFTYLHRLRLKRRLKKKFRDCIVVG